MLNISTPVAGGPYEITFNDGELLTLKNILIGEVWFCSGQSNMEMPMSGFDRQPTQGTNDVIAKAKPLLQSVSTIQILRMENGYVNLAKHQKRIVKVNG